MPSLPIDIAPAGVFLLYFVEDFLRDNCFVILLRSVSVYLAVIGLPLRLVFAFVLIIIPRLPIGEVYLSEYGEIVGNMPQPDRQPHALGEDVRVDVYGFSQGFGVILSQKVGGDRIELVAADHRYKRVVKRICAAVFGVVRRHAERDKIVELPFEVALAGYFKPRRPLFLAVGVPIRFGDCNISFDQHVEGYTHIGAVADVDLHNADINQLRVIDGAYDIRRKIKACRTVVAEKTLDGGEQIVVKPLGDIIAERTRLCH